MRAVFRIAIITLLLFVVIFLGQKFGGRHSLWASHQPVTTPEQDGATGVGHDNDIWPTAGDKIVVMASIKTEQTDWVGQYLPDWQQAIYQVDNPKAAFHVPMNKGREAMAYLTYLIDHYNSLPSIIAFLHPHEDGYPGAWHTDADDYSNVNSLNTLRLDYVQEQGYANLRCLQTPGCPNEIQPFREPYEDHRGAEHAMPEVWPRFFGNETEVPRTIGAACCGQFAVSRAQVLKRPLQEYKTFRDWLIETPLHDDVSGRVLEYLWHIIFGRDPIHCPDLTVCYCNVYGKYC